MPEYLSPGVYVEEVQTGPRPIEGVSTSTAAFLGQTERGPLAPRLISSWTDFQRWYGGYLPVDQSYLGYAVQGFFSNGGQRLFIGRIVGNGAAWAENDFGSLHISAIGSGNWGERIFVRIDDAMKRGEHPDWFRLTLLYYRADNMPPDPANVVDPLNPANSSNRDRREPDAVEVYDNLVHTPGADNNVVTVVNTASKLVRVWFPQTPPVAVALAANYQQLAIGVNPGANVDANSFPGNNNLVRQDLSATPEIAELFGRGTGLAALSAIDEISLIAVPDEVLYYPDATNPSPVTNNIIDQCEQLKDRFALVSEARGSDRDNVRPRRDTTYAAVYYPWIEIYDPLSRGPIRVPPTGHIAGIIARTDIERGVHKAPANEVVRGALNLEFPVTKARQDQLNPQGVNCIRDFRPDGRGIRLWGARTMSSDSMWKYVNVRRLFLYIEESIDEGTQWVVFEPNDDPTWAAVRRSITNFLISTWRSGALMGTTQEEAFFVKCDRTTMTQDDIDNGRLICLIGVAPVKPAEFVIFRISQKALEAVPA